jgi:hypothetical protein
MKGNVNFYTLKALHDISITFPHIKVNSESYMVILMFLINKVKKNLMTSQPSKP